MPFYPITRFIDGFHQGYFMAMDATDVFSQWALAGKDEGMERGHAPSVSQMLDLVLPKVPEVFEAIDLGCGNGWVVRLLSKLGATHVEGVDGSLEMIEKAKITDSNGIYSHGLLPDWKPTQRFDLVHSMEFLYYLKDPEEMLALIHDEWLKDGGFLVAGVDHYAEHEDSLGWPEHVGVHMTTLTIEEWTSAMSKAGFCDIEIHQVAKKEGFPGTLVMLGRTSR